MSSLEHTYFKDLHTIIKFIDQICDLQTIENLPCQTPLLLGKPGGGKTQSIESLAKEKDDEFFSSHFALMSLEDYGGIPQFKTEVIRNKKTLTTEWSLPEFVSVLYKKSDIAYTKQFGGFLIKNKLTDEIQFGIPKVTEFNDELKKNYNFDPQFNSYEYIEGDNKNHRVLLLLDDIHRCDYEHQTALMEMLSEKKLKSYQFPKNTAIILAGNFESIAGAKAFLSPVVNRCMYLYVNTNYKYWKENFALTHNINPVIIAFLNSYPECFHQDEINDSPWASPRSWTNFSNVLSHLEKSNKKSKLEPTDIAYLTFAHVGKDISEKFTQFYTLFNEFETDEIFKTVKTDKDFFKYMDKYDYTKQYSLVYACINYFIQHYNNKTKKDLYNVILCILKAYNSKDHKYAHAELGVTIMKEINIIISSDPKKYNKTEFFKLLTETTDSGGELFSELVGGILAYTS